MFMKLRILLVLAIATTMFFAVIYCSGKKAPVVSPDEITSLRHEVDALRDEVARLRTSDARKWATDANRESFSGGQSSPAEIMTQLKNLRAQADANQRAWSSNLAEITLDRGSDAWARGDLKKA